MRASWAWLLQADESDDNASLIAYRTLGKTVKTKGRSTAMEEKGLGKLLPKGISAKRRQKKQSQQSMGSANSDEAPRGRSFVSREMTESDGDHSFHVEGEDDDDAANMALDESDHES